MRTKSIIPWQKRAGLGNGGQSLLGLRGDLDRLFEEFVQSLDLEPFAALKADVFSPRVSVTEDDASFKVSAELPGMEEKDIEVELGEGSLTIKGEKKEEHEEKDENRLYSERIYGAFTRTIPLPGEIERDRVEATFKKGVLTVTLPKTEKARTERRKIPVKA